MSTLNTMIAAASSPITVTGDQFTQEFVFAEDFVGFHGHFPDNPVLPAVVQLMAGAYSARQAAAMELSVTGTSRAKFLRQVKPGERIVLTGTLTPTDCGFTAVITLSVDDECASTFHIKLLHREAS